MRSSLIKATGTLLLFVCFFYSKSFAQTRYYVNYAATGTGVGTSWANAYTDLTAALTKAVAGNEVWVAKGTYNPVVTPLTSTFTIKPGVQVYGGFAGTETLASQRIVGTNGLFSVNETILDGQYNNYHVVSSTGGTATTVFDGFTLIRGNTLSTSVSNSANYIGAGLYVISGAGTFQNLWIKDNYATFGAGIYNSGTATFKNIIVEGNVLAASGNGAGIYNNGVASFQHVSILNNSGASQGGGMHNVATNLQLSDVSFIGNTATTFGGGLNSTVSMTLDKVSFIENIAATRGGGFYSTGTVTMNNTVFSRNSVTSTIASSLGGGMYVTSGSVNLYNSTFSNNTIGYAPADNTITYGAALYSPVTTVNVYNSIFWGNKRGGDVPDQVGAIKIIMDYNVIQGGYPTGSNNIIGDPLFTNPLTNDLRLKKGSIAIDAGINAQVATGLDVAGNTRTINGIVDMGAYEDPVGRTGSLAILPGSLSVLTRGIAINQQLTVQGGAGTITWSLPFGSLPAGITFNTQTGVLSGTPTIAGSYVFVVKATQGGLETSKQYNVQVNAGIARLYVNAAATGFNNGIDFNNGYTRLQSALTLAVSGDEIWVAKGSYSPNASVDSSFTMVSGVKMYGGFAGTETQASQRIADQSGRFTANEVILNGNQGNKHVIWNKTLLSAETLIDGFTVIQGTGADGLGGGLCILAATVNGTYRNLIIKWNTAVNYGGGMNNAATAIKVENVLFEGNLATNASTKNGGGLYNSGANAIFNNLVFRNNQAGTGGGMSNLGANVVINKIMFDGNTSSVNGGGLYNSGAGLIINDGTFQNNVAGTLGGGMHNLASATLTKTVFNNNQSTGTGGGLSNTAVLTLDRVSFIANNAAQHGGGLFTSGAVTVNNAVFSRNNVTVASYLGGGMYFSGGASSITNATFSNNTVARVAINSGAGLSSNGTLNIYNSIFWGNTRSAGVFDQLNSGVTGISYSTVQEGYPTGTNISIANPLFTDAATDNLTLKGGSLAIDRGTNSASGTTLDFAGNPRIYNTTVDQGAYENQGSAGLTITPVSLGTINRGTAYNIQLTAANGTAPYTWTIVAGALPPGLSLTTDGRIAGVPTTFLAGGYTFAISVTDGALVGTNQYTLVPTQAPVRLYVNQGLTTGDKSGGSWTNAFAEFTDALKVAVAGDEIWVARGTYSPGTAVGSTFTMVEGVKWYGGFAGNETALTQRLADSNLLFSINETILDGAGVNYHVVYNALALTNATVIDGFSVANGRSAVGSNSGILYSAGGIYNNLGAAVFRNLWVKNNKAYYWGGGIYNNAPSTFENIRFENNTATGNTGSSGGGIYNTTGLATFTNLTFVGNESLSGGGFYGLPTEITTLNNTVFLNNKATDGAGLYNGRSVITLKNAVFDGNIASRNGGAIFNSTTFNGEDLVIKNNTAVTSGAGIYNSGTMTLNRGSFIANISGGFGAGIYNTAVATLDNIIFSRNATTLTSAGGFGAGMYHFAGTSNLTNVTFSNNTTSATAITLSGAGFFYRASGTATIYNSIFWGNKRNGVADQIGGAATVLNTVVEGGYAAGTNISIGNPSFVDATTDNLRLKSGSSAIDGGENSASKTISDLDVKPRVINDVVDMGAYENQGTASLAILPAILPVQDRGTLLIQQFTASGGGTALTWSISSGTLPTGLTLSTSGLLTGRLMVTGSYTFVIAVTDGEFLGSKQYNYTVNSVSTHLFTSVSATSGINNGISWTNAFTDLKSAVKQAVSGDEIWVAKGNYSPGLLVSDSYTLKDGVKIFGGFAGTEETFAARDTSLVHTVNKSILDGSQGAGNYHVVYNIIAVGTGTILDGFTISGGRALTTTSAVNGIGAGIYSSLGSPGFNNLRITNNNALYGGGVYIGAGSPTFKGTQFIGNTTTGASGRGAAMYINTGSIVDLSKVNFDGNIVTTGTGTYGGAIMNYGTLSISDATFKNNDVEGTGFAYGGAICNTSSAGLKVLRTSFTGNIGLTGGAVYLAAGTSEFTDVIFKENKARGTGGGVNSLGTPVFNRVYFIANEAVQHGGGLFSSSTPKLDNVVFSRNKVTSTGAFYGGGMYSTTATLSNVTFSNNSIARIGAGGGGLFRSGGTVTINNSIFWGNSYAGGISDQISGVVTINKSIVQGGYATGTNIGIGDPLFVNADLDNLRLKGGSPAIDQGDNTKSTTTIDILGNSRVFNNIVDFGAYENQGTASLTILPATMAAVNRGDTFLIPLTASGDGTGLMWTITSGSLPSGLTLTATGEISGRPMVSGSFTFVVGATNGELVGSKQYTLVVNAAGTILYVNAGATAGLNDGSNWQNGFIDLKNAIVKSVAGDQIWVAKGVYSPGLLATDWFTLKEGVKTYGGFAGTEKVLTERDLKLVGTTNQSILDGSQGVASRHVIYNSAALTNATILDGFTISGGQGLTGADSDNNRGAGIYNATTVKAIFSNLLITNNKGERGAGVYNQGTASFDHLLIQQNAANISGGGFFNTAASVTMSDIVFKDNTALNYGGGLVSSGASLVLSRVSFTGNISAFHGGGFYLYGGSASLENVVFSRNAVTNASSYYGAGMFTAVAATLTNVTFSNNNIAFTNATTAGGAGLYRSGGVVTVDNSIFWGNKRGGGIPDQLGPNVTLRQSIVEGGYSAGTAVFIGDPLFTDAATDNLQLKGGSPGIDAGNNSKTSSLTDLAGNTRLINETVDLGAYENQGSASLKILPATLGPFIRGIRVAIQMTTTGGTGINTWTLQSGKLPAGLVLSNDGKLTGVPTTIGTYVFVIGTTGGGLIGSKQYTVSTTAGSTRLYVYQNATGENTGSDWINAMNDLQSAISLSSAGDEIWVAKGTYSPGILASSYFVLKEGVKMYGGFAATELALAERDSVAVRSTNETILDGSQGTVSNHVVYNNAALTAATVLDGFSIQGGAAGANGFGGGIYNTAGTAVFHLLWIKNNTATYGGGLYHSGDAKYTNINFTSNQSKSGSARGAGVYNVTGFKLSGGIFENNKIIDVTGYGAAIFNTGPLTLRDVKFDNNSLITGNGGAIYSQGAAVVTADNISFTGNKAGSGGAVYLANGTQTFTDVVFKNNAATSTGGAVVSGGTLTLNRNQFLENTSVQHGGAIWSSGTIKADNSIFSQNSVSSTAGYYGAAAYISSGTASFINSTFSSNNISYVNTSTALSYGGAFYRAGGTVSIYNSILWGNKRGSNVPDQLNAGIAVDNSIVQNNYSAGTEIKIGDPMFVDAAGDNLRLKAGSLAIDAGINTWQVYDKDLAGTARVINSVVDLGAYENDGSGSLLISPAHITAIKRGVNFDAQLIAVGSTLPVSWIVKDGKLPPGISLSADGHMTGVPTTAGSYTFVIGASDGAIQGNKQYTITIQAGPSRLYVAQVAIGNNSGVSWTNAFTELTPALALAAAGDEIWVAKGVYSPGLTVTSYFTLKEGVKIYGGFAGTELALTERDTAAVRTLNETILDGSKGVASYHVVYNAAALTSATVLDGFSIQGGAASTTNGGGIYNTAGTGIFNLLWIKNNTAVYGAGLYHSGDAVYTNIIFSNNQSKGANARGAGVYNIKGFKLTGGVFDNNKIVETTGYGAGIFSTGLLELTDVRFNSNTIITGQGGAIYSNSNASLIVNRSSFIANQSTTGGALLIANGSSNLTDVVFKNNAATGAGGAIYVSGGMILNRTSFLNNSSVQHGGAIWTNSTLKVDNSIFSNNMVSSTSGYYGGAIYNSGNVLINNSTFSGNSIAYTNASLTLSYGAALYHAAGVTTVHNSIFWGNKRGANVADQLNAGVTIASSIVQNNYAAGTAIKIGNPLFTSADDLHIKAGSLAIDAGVNSWQAFDKDLEGNTRVINSVIDLGAYESNGGTGITVSPATLAPVVRGIYQDIALSYTGSSLPVSWTLDAGILPKGLVLRADGRLVGTPTVIGSYTFVIKADDGTLIGNRQYTIVVQNGIGRLYVAQAATGDNNGSNWANAFTDLQPALALATAQDEIWVAKGTYSAGPLATSSFILKEGVKIYGGLAGTESALTERDSTLIRSTNETILDGSQGVASYHVVYNNNTAAATALTSATVLDGFSIQGGGTLSNYGSSYTNVNTFGGGMYNVGGAATFRHLWIKNNLGSYGAGLYHSGNAIYIDIRFTNNRSTGYSPRGSAVYNAGGFKLVDGLFENNKIIESASYTGYGAAIFNTGGADLDKVRFENNTITNGQGGAIYGYGTLMMSNTSFNGNMATGGGAMYITSGAPVLSKVVFTNNSATLAGGAVYVSGGMTMDRTSFVNNSAVQHGGAIWSNGTLNVSNSIFSHNKVTSAAAYYGGAIYIYSGAAKLTNSSFSNNSINYVKAGLVNYGAAVFRNAGTATINNSILWGNTRGGSTADQLTAAIIVNNSLIQGGYATGSNIVDASPAFMNADADDLSLTGCSPAINTGDNTLLTGSLDFLGNARKNSVQVDMGAIEYQQSVLLVSPVVLPQGKRGELFTQQLQAAGGNANTSFEVISGKLPDGISMSRNGLLTGNPFVIGKFTFTVKVSDGTLCGYIINNIDVVAGTGVVRMYVNGASVSGANNGSTWSDAYLDLQSALKVSLAGDEIWVAKGNYNPGVLVTSTYKLVEGVKTYGGFAGTEKTVAERDSVNIRQANQTILDGQGIARHVIYNNLPLTNATLLDGFTITGGKAGTTSGNGSEIYNGGGIYNSKGAATFNNLWIKGNSATSYGGGMVNSGTSLLNKITFENNTVSIGSYQQGGGLYNNGASTLNNIEFINNRASSGGGMFHATAAVTMSNILFRGNIADVNGGGLVSYSGKVVLDRASFAGNKSGQRGAGIYGYVATLALTNTIFNNNQVTGTGYYFGGAYYQLAGTAVLTNVTMVNNSIAYVSATASKFGGAISKNSGTLTLQNSILWNNTRGNGIDDELNPNIKVNNTVVKGGYLTGTTILDKDPLFNLGTVDDFSLSACSPAINMGDNSLSAGITKDFLGDPRIKAETVDLGAHENQQDRIIVTPATLPDGTRGTKYEQQLTAGGGSGSYTYSVSYGKLPDGLLLSASGQITGRPINAGTYIFNINASDGNLCGNRLYTVNVSIGTGKVRIYVNQAATAGMNNSADWQNGFLDLQKGISSAIAGDTIWVAKGNYSPGLLATSYFVLKEGVKIYGGFAATEKELSDRDTTLFKGANQTILNGGNKSYHVVYNKVALTKATVLDGFTITGGHNYSGNTNYDYCGGGIMNYGGSMIFRNLWVKNNIGYYYGGGIYSNTASEFTNITLENNTAAYGGGLSNLGASVFNNIQFIGNGATDGGGLHNRSNAINLTGVTFTGNTASGTGGAIYNITGNVVVKGAKFIANTSVRSGGAIYQQSGALTVYNAVFSRNKVTSTAGYFGGAVYSYSGVTNLINTSISNNAITYVNASATSKYGGALFKYSGTLNVYNSILWGNKRGNNVSDQLPAGIVMANSTVENGYVAGTQILVKDPQFTNAAADDLSLAACSPSVNMGDNTKVQGITQDIAGGLRIMHNTVDIGAYEFQGVYLDNAEQTLADANQWESYTQQITLSQSGAYTFTVTQGLLPDGLSINSTGKVTGIATVAGLYELTLAVSGSDACGSVKVKMKVLAKEPYIIEVLTPYPVPVKKDTGTPFGALNLVTEVEVVLSDKTHVKYPVTWQEGNYNGTVEGLYTLTGIITVPSPTVNKDNLQATAKVAVIDPVFPYIASIAQLAPVYVLSGTPFTEVLPLLPKQVKVTYDNGLTDMLNLTWRAGTYELQAGIYRVYASIVLKEEHANPVGFEANLDVYAQLNIVEIEELADITVPLHTVASALPLPLKVRVTYHDQTTGLLNVSWDTTPYMADKGAEYELKGTPQLTTLVSNTNSLYAVDKVIIRKNIVSVNPLPAVSTAYNTLFDDVELPQQVNVVFDDATVDPVGVEWKPGSYNQKVSGDYHLSGTLLYDESIDNTNNLEVAILLTVLPRSKNIVSVATLDTVGVSYGQLLTAVPELKLPVLVTYDDGTTGSLAVTWDTEGYDASISGSYTFPGRLLLINGVINTDDLPAGITLKVGHKSVVEVKNPASIEVDYGTPADDIDLPETVGVKYNDNTTGTEGVVWTSANYNPLVEGSYIFTGTLTNDDTIGNPDNLLASITVKVGPKPLKVISAIVDLVNIPFGTVFTNALLLFPKQALVTYDNGTKGSLNVIWKEGDYDGDQPGTYLLDGTLVMTAGIINPDSVEVEIKAIVGIHVISTYTPVPVVNVAFGTAAADLILPETVNAQFVDGDDQDLGVTWNLTNYNGNVEGKYIIKGEFTLTDDIENPNLVIPQVEINVAPRPKIIVLLKTDTLNVSYGTALGGIVFPVVSNATLDEGTKTTIPVVLNSFAVTSYEGTVATDYDGNADGAYLFEGLITPPDGIQNPTNLTPKVLVIVAKKAIESLSPAQGINVAFGTPFEGLTLPESVNAIYNDLSEELVPVTWAMGNYDHNTPGVYTLQGALILTDGIANPKGLQPVIKVTVSEKIRTLVSIAKDSIDVPYGTTQALAGLPLAVNGLFDDGSTLALTIKGWETLSYDSLTAGKYGFYSEVIMPLNTVNPDGIMAAMDVNVMDKYIVAVTAAPDMIVPYGTLYPDLLLPAAVNVTYNNSSQGLVTVMWDAGSYDGTIAGTYILQGTLVPDEEGQNRDNETAAIRIIVQPKLMNIDSVVFTTPIHLPLGTTLDQALTALGIQQKVIYTDKTVGITGVNWASALFNGNLPATYNFVGLLIPAADAANPKDIFLKAEVIIDRKNIVAVETATALTDVYGRPFEELQLPASVRVTYDDKTTELLPVSWSDANYKSDIFDQQTLTGAIELTNDVTNTLNIPATVKVTLYKNIDSVAAIEPVIVPYGTPFGSLKLPATVAVTFNDGSIVNLPVVWDEAAYAAAPVGELLLTGQLTLLPNMLNTDQLTANSVITIQKATQTLVFDAVVSHMYGDVPIKLSATASSGLPVTYVLIQGPVGISEGLVNIEGTGEVTVKAVQLGNAFVEQVESIQTFTINKAVLKIYGDSLIRLTGQENPVLTYHIGGFKYGETEALLRSEEELSGAPLLSTDAVISSVSGEYPIVVEAGDLDADNYEFSFVPGLLTVKSSIHTVTWNSNGGTEIVVMQVEDGSKITAAVVTKDGYVFYNWFSEETLTTAFNFDLPVMDDITLYADWQLIPLPLSGPISMRTIADYMVNLGEVTAVERSAPFSMSLLNGKSHLIGKIAPFKLSDWYGYGQLKKAVLKTMPVSGSASTSIVAGVVLVNDGGSAITAAGICWSTNPEPTIAATKAGGLLVSGSAVATVTGLNPGVKYYLKSYATNSAGTAYGNEIVFMIKDDGSIEIGKK